MNSQTETFAGQLEALRPRLLRSAQKYYPQREHDAEDLVSDTICKALTKQHLFRSGTNLWGWTCTILRNLFVNRYRREQCFGPTGEKQTEAAFRELTDSSTTGQEHLEAAAVRTALDRLTTAQSDALQLFAEGLSYREIEVALQRPTGTIRSGMHHARVRLARQLIAVGYVSDRLTHYANIPTR